MGVWVYASQDHAADGAKSSKEADADDAAAPVLVKEESKDDEDCDMEEDKDSAWLLTQSAWENIADLHEKADVNKDGVLSLQEFETMIEQALLLRLS